MEDYFGNELQVGDTVVYLDYYKSPRGWVTGVNLKKGTITKLYKKMVEIDGQRRSAKKIIKIGVL